MLGKCVRRCWDSQTEKRYYIGMVDDLPKDHIFFTMKVPCFEPLTPEDLRRSQDNPNVKVAQLAEIVAKQGKQIDELRQPMKTDELIPESATEAKRGPGNPNWKKKD